MKQEKASVIHQFARWYVGMTSRRPWTSLAIFMAITVVMAILAGRLHISTDLRLLLPSNTPSVRALELSEKRLGSTDFYTLAFEDSSAEKVGRFQKALAESLQSWKPVKWVQYDQDRSFFVRHALLYLPEDQLTDLEGRLTSMSKGAQAYNPLLLDLGETPSAPANLDGWPDKTALFKQGIPMDVVERLLQQVGRETGSKSNAISVTKGEASDPDLPDSLSDRMLGWHGEKGKWVGVVMAQLSVPATEAAFSQEAKDKGEALAAQVQKDLGFRLHFKVVGAYADPSSELSDINSDMWVSSIVAMVLILGLLLFYMRRPANVLVVFVPLLCAMSWMMGTAELVYGRLTVLTSFVLALLSGLGIEYSIHVYSRWMEERRKGLSVEEAMIVSLSRTGRSLISAMTASIVCMLALQVGHFQGFKEFGIVVSMGIALAFLASVLLLPPLLFALLGVGRTAAARGWTRLEHLAPSERQVEGAVLVPLWSWPRWLLRTGFVLSVLITAFFALAPSVQFENDFANLRSGKGKLYWLTSRIDRLLSDKRAEEDGISYGRAVGEGKNTSPSVVLASSEKAMRRVHDTLGARFGAPGDSMLKSFVTIQSFVPRPEAQQRRLEVLRRIRAVLDGPGFEKADSSEKAQLAMLRRYTLCDTFGFDSLPPYARRFLTESDGSHGKFGLIYAEMRESDAVESKKFQDRYSHFEVGTDSVQVASSGFIYADVVDMVKKDVKSLATFVFLFLAVVVILDTRSWRGFAVNMGYIGLISFWTYGAMGWLGLKLGMFNIVVLPALLSNTVDATIHLYHRRMEVGRGHIGKILHTAGSSVLAGTLTNAFGFLSLVVVGHRGLNTIGMLASLGYAASILIIFLTMPWVLEVVCPKEPQEVVGEE
jgi:predicted RND superfamily exporter protein